MNPTLSGFLRFLRESVKIPVADMPDDSTSYQIAYGAAMDLVNDDIQKVMPTLYTQAVYDLATSFLVNYGSEEIFAQTRQNLGLNNLSVGVISSASDNSTSASKLVPDFFKNLSLADLQMLRDPWGRKYLMIAQQFGSLWLLT